MIEILRRERGVIHTLLLGIVRNMGNFNLFQTHVLMFFHHVEQCCYLTFLIIPHTPAMTSHVAYVIYVIHTLITTQGLCNITISLCLSFFMHLGPYSFLMFLTFSFLSLISMSPYSLCIDQESSVFEHS